MANKNRILIVYYNKNYVVSLSLKRVKRVLISDHSLQISETMESEMKNKKKLLCYLANSSSLAFPVWVVYFPVPLILTLRLAEATEILQCNVSRGPQHCLCYLAWLFDSRNSPSEAHTPEASVPSAWGLEPAPAEETWSHHRALGAEPLVYIS